MSLNECLEIKTNHKVCKSKFAEKKHMFLLNLLTKTNPNHTNLELLLHSSQSLEQTISLLVTGNKPLSMSVNDCWEDEILYTVSYPLEVVGDTDKSLHLPEILGLNFFQGRVELEVSLPGE